LAEKHLVHRQFIDEDLEYNFQFNKILTKCQVNSCVNNGVSRKLLE
jgi:hypothetical protein